MPRLPLVTLLLWLSAITLAVGDPQLFDCNGSPAILTLWDNTTVGSELFTFSGASQDPEIVQSDCDFKDHLTYANNSFVLAKSITSFCRRNTNCKIKCDVSEKPIQLLFRRELIDNYNIALKNSTAEIDITENNMPGMTRNLSSLMAIDFPGCESPSVWSVSYITFNESDEFQLHDTLGQKILKVKKSLDFEKQRKYTLKLGLSGQIGDTEFIHGSGQLVVNVLDADDQDPTFNLTGYDAKYMLHIAEEDTSAVNKYRSTSPPVHAYDKDLGIRDTLVYSIAYPQNQDLFEVNNVTGQIRVTQTLDRENQTEYSLVLKATQESDALRTATAALVVIVDDINDNRPMFDPVQYSGTVREHAAQGSSILTVTATDKDAGNNSLFHYTIYNQTLPLSVNEQGEISVRNSSGLDRISLGDTITFQVGTVETVSGEKGGNNATVTLILEDINNHSPSFTESQYDFIIQANVVGSVLGQVSAADLDAGGNGNVSYEFFPPSQSSRDCQAGNDFPIAIDEWSGNVILTQADPMCSTYSVNVEACDHPTIISTRRCSVALVTVHYHNQTNASIAITQTMSVWENIGNGTARKTVGILKCSGERYEIDPPDDFQVDGSSGIVKSVKPLDREIKDTYDDMDVYVFSQSGQVTCNISLTITVLDENDNPPVFVKPVYMFGLPLSSTGGSAVKVEATDADAGDNGKVTYGIQPSGSSAYFEINAATGVISLKNGAHLRRDIYELYVKAEDQGSPSLKSNARVYLSWDGAVLPISTPWTVEAVKLVQSQLESNLSRILGVDVSIETVMPVSGSGQTLSRMNVTGKDPTVTKEDLLRLGVQHWDQLQTLFYTASCPNCTTVLKVPVDRDVEGTLRAPEIALIAMACVILVGTVLAILLIVKQFKSHKRYKRLYENLTRNSSFYESQELKMELGDETSDYNGSVNTQELESQENGGVTPGQTQAIVNPAFSENEQLSSTPRDPAEVEAIESLNDLSDRLNREDGDQETKPEEVLASRQENHETNDLPGENGQISPDNSSGDEYANIGMAWNAGQLEPAGSISSVATETMDEPQPGQVMQADAAGDCLDDLSDEPNPDYDFKQVRFSSEVLNTNENKIEPLKADQSAEDGESIDTGDTGPTDREAGTYDTSDLGTGGDTTDSGGSIILPVEPVPHFLLESDEEADTSRDTDEQGWVEEEINSPASFVRVESSNTFSFGEDQMTAF